jgi:hypothetical protein
MLSMRDKETRKHHCHVPRNCVTQHRPNLECHHVMAEFSYIEIGRRRIALRRNTIYVEVTHDIG